MNIRKHGYFIFLSRIKNIIKRWITTIPYIIYTLFRPKKIHIYSLSVYKLMHGANFLGDGSNKLSN